MVNLYSFEDAHIHAECLCRHTMLYQVNSQQYYILGTTMAIKPYINDLYPPMHNLSWRRGMQAIRRAH